MEEGVMHEGDDDSWSDDTDEKDEGDTQEVP